MLDIKKSPQDKGKKNNDVPKFRRSILGNIRAKLIVAFLVITVISVGIVAFIAQQSLSAGLKQNIGDNIAELANLRATEIGLALQHELQMLQVLALNTVIQDAATSYSHTVPLSQVEIERRDQQWKLADTANNDTDSLVASVINNEAASELRIFKEQFPQHARVILTNLQGVNIASTNRISTYFHADQAWWKIAYQDGIFIGQPEYDASSKIVAITMAVPVRENGVGKIMGILRTTVSFRTLSDSLIAGYFGRTGRTYIYLPAGWILKVKPRGDGTFELIQEYASPEIRELVLSTEASSEIYQEDVPTFAGHATMSIPGSTDAKSAIALLNWDVITLQDQSEALQLVDTQTRNIILITIAILVAVIFAAFGLARLISNPISRLNTVAGIIASGDLTVEAKVETRDEIGTLADTFNKMTAQLRDLFGTLEQRVAERTAELEISLVKNQERTAQLQAVAEVARSIATLKGVNQLLPVVTRLISQRFGFNHVGIFLLDKEKEFAVLRAANSEGGQKMLARSHKLRIGQQGIVGDAVEQKKAHIALDVGEDGVFFDNPDLPDTRSEMALPLMIGNEVIGALDVQSNHPNAFSEEDIQVLTTLADQVAIAIENTNLYEQSQIALQELENTLQRYIRNEWQQYSEMSSLKGYLAHSSGLEPITGLSRENSKMDQKGIALKVPVSLRGVTIGTLDVDLGKQLDQYTREEMDIIEAAAERVALALEAARLLEESQRRAAKEQTISAITAKIGASINVRNVIQTAVEELGRVLPGSEVEFLLEKKQAS